MNNVHENDDKLGIFAFVYDSGDVGSGCYGDVVFDRMMEDGELAQNPVPVVVRLGDVSACDEYNRPLFMRPFLLWDQYCHMKNVNFKDWPYCFICENLSAEIAMKLHDKLSNTARGYVGVTRVDLDTRSGRQLLGRMITYFEVNKNRVTFLTGDPECTGGNVFHFAAESLGYDVYYDVDGVRIKYPIEFDFED